MVQRWISGSINDPDWDETWLKEIKDVKSAFFTIQRIIGNRLSVNKPLWRYLGVSKKTAIDIDKTKFLKPHNILFQSFTTSEKSAYDFADIEEEPKNIIKIIVNAKVSSNKVMFGINNLLCERRNYKFMLIRSLREI